MNNDVNYTFAFAGSNGTPQVLPDGPMFGDIHKVDFNTWKQRASAYGWHVDGTDIYDPTITTPDQARQKYGSGNGGYIAQGQTQYDKLLAANGVEAKAIRAAETGGAPVSFGKMIDGNLVGNDAIASEAAHKAAVAAGTEKIAKTENGVNFYVPTNGPGITPSPSGPAPGQPGYVAPNGQTPANGQPNTQGMAETFTGPDGKTLVLNKATGRYDYAPDQTAPQAGAGAQQTQQSQSYVVKPGDTINAIAARLGVSPSQITGYRSGNPNKIYSGETLQIGSSQPVYTPTTKDSSIPGGGTTTKSPIQEHVDMYTEAAKALGLPTIKSQYEDTLKQQQSITDQQNQEISDINNDPWLVQSVRDKRVAQVKNKYETKLNTYSNLAKLYESLYEKGVTQVNEIVTKTEADLKYAAQIAQKQSDAANAIMKDNQIVSIGGNYWLVNKVTGQKMVNLGPQTHFSSSSSIEEQINALFQ